MNETDQKQEKDPAGGADRENLFAVALARNDDSFPVLKAFQGFLDRERERARRRVVTLSICFIAAMFAMAVAFGAIFAVFFSHMMSQNEQQQSRLLDLVAESARQRDEAVRAATAAPALAPAPAPAPVAVQPTPAPAPAKDDSAVSARELLEAIKLLSENRNAAPPADAAPGSAGILPAVEPAPAPEAAKPEPPKTGVISSPYRKDQEARLAAEKEARERRAAARKAASEGTAEGTAGEPPAPPEAPPAPPP
ncbi:MAG: hypothetical protein IJ783_03585, partial [Kiritimatiellae bacterium]|nr:hypothetical protein [Kiritimatiellia bacterium]